jgi:hypothetical protein
VQGTHGLARAGLAAAFLLAAAPAVARKNVTAIDLRFSPSTALESARPALAGSLLEHPVDLRVVDGRTAAAAGTIGTRTDGAGGVFELTTPSDVAGFAEIAVHEAARAWGLPVRVGAGSRLAGRILELRIAETNRAMGAAFEASVRMGFELRDPRGDLAWSGTTGATATRRGRKFSGANCNEVLSDAVVEAFAALLASPELQAAWPGGDER